MNAPKPTRRVPRTKKIPRATKRVGGADLSASSSSVQPAARVCETTVAPYIVKVHEAKTTLSKLIRRVLDGERIVIARDTIAVAELIPLRATLPAGRARQFGALTGVVSLTPAFYEPLPPPDLDSWE